MTRAGDSNNYVARDILRYDKRCIKIRLIPVKKERYAQHPHSDERTILCLSVFPSFSRARSGTFFSLLERFL